MHWCKSQKHCLLNDFSTWFNKCPSGVQLYSIALSTLRKLFGFFTSVLVPNRSAPRLLHRYICITAKWPSSKFPSQIPRYITICRLHRKYWYASCADRISGSAYWNFQQGTPLRLMDDKCIDIDIMNWFASIAASCYMNSRNTYPFLFSLRSISIHHL